MKINKLIEKIKNIKHFQIYIALILIFVAIIIYLCVLSEDSKSVKNTNQSEIEQTLSKIEGVGECEVFVSYEKDNTPIGVVVVCEGANNIKVVENLTIAIKTLLNINEKNIKIYKSKLWRKT